MEPRFHGIDLNGQSDRVARLTWPSDTSSDQIVLYRPEVIEQLGSRTGWVAGEEAKQHPAGRGWSQPLWTESAFRRHSVASSLADLRYGRTAALPILTEHLRYLSKSGNRFGLAIPDDLNSEAQTLLLDAARRATRHTPKHGSPSWTARPIWRSVAALFGWAQLQSPDSLGRLKEKHALVLSLLADRLVAARIELDVHETEAGLLLTPVRSERGRAFDGENYPPSDIEQDVLEAVTPSSLRAQLALVGAGADYIRGSCPNILLQNADGRWRLPPRLSVDAELRSKSLRAFAEQLREVVHDHCPLIVIDAPDENRGFPDRSWAGFAAEVVQRHRPSAQVVHLAADAVARGCAEYEARLEHRLPTFFDYLPQIEIVAQDEADQLRFVALFPERRRVRGNEAFHAQLDGKFGVPAGASKLTFHLFKDEEERKENVRKSVTELPIQPDRTIPISLRVEQRPVSGHASIEVVPVIEGALGPARVMLDWREMEPTGKTRPEVIAQLERERPRAYPNPAPTRTHPAVWTALRLEAAMERFLREPASIGRTYGHAIDQLKSVIGRQANPAYVGGDLAFNEALNPFDSNGQFPSEGRLLGRRDELVAQVRAKISRDMAALTQNRAGDRTVRQLCLIGGWMFAGAPEAVVAYFRRIMRQQIGAGHLTEAIGRTVKEPDDIRLAFEFLRLRLHERQHASPPWKGATKELKAAANILRFRPEAGRLLSMPQAEVIVDCALGTMYNELDADGGTRRLQQRFLWAAMAFLLALRFRQENRAFLQPESSGHARERYVFAQTILEHARDAIRRRRRCHRLAPSAVENALAFLTQAGGDPDIIEVISRGLDEDSSGSDDDSD